MEKKNVVFLTILAVATLLTAVAGATFAYFSMGVGGTGNSAGATTVKTAVVAGVDYTTGQTISQPDGGAYPGWKGVQTFEIKLPSNTPSNATGGTYTVKLTPNVPAAFKQDIKYTVYKLENASTSDSITVTSADVSNSSGHLTTPYTMTKNGKLSSASPLVTTTALTGTSAITIDTVQYSGTLKPTKYFIVYEYADNGDQSTQQGQTFTASVKVDVALNS